MSTISIISRKVFRFPNPDPSASVLNAGNDVNQVAFRKAYFDTVPGEVQQAPAWIKKDRMWELAESDGDIMEVVVKAKVTVAELNKKAALAQQAGLQNAVPVEKEEEAEVEEVKEDEAETKDELAEPAVNLNKLNKDKLIAHVAENHPELEIDPAMTKAEIIAKVEDHLEEKKQS